MSHSTRPLARYSSSSLSLAKYSSRSLYPDYIPLHLSSCLTSLSVPPSRRISLFFSHSCKITKYTFHLYFFSSLHHARYLSSYIFLGTYSVFISSSASCPSSYFHLYLLLDIPLDFYILLDIPLNIYPFQIYISIQPSRWISLFISPFYQIFLHLPYLSLHLHLSKDFSFRLSSCQISNFISSLARYVSSSLLYFRNISIHLYILQDISLHLYLLQDASIHLFITQPLKLFDYKKDIRFRSKDFRFLHTNWPRTGRGTKEIHQN